MFVSAHDCESVLLREPYSQKFYDVQDSIFQCRNESERSVLNLRKELCSGSA